MNSFYKKPMKVIYFFLFFTLFAFYALLPTLLNAQTPDTMWLRTYSPALSGKSVQQTSDGGYIVVGNTTGFLYDIYLIKTDSLGDTLWTKVYGVGDRQDIGECIQQTLDGGYIVGGRIEYFGPPRSYVYMLKTNSQGDTLWTRTYGPTDSEKAFFIQQTTDGGYILTGSSGNNLLLMKTDSDGDTIWTKIYGTGNSDRGYSVQQTSDGGYIITGYKGGSGPIWEYVWLLKTDNQGDTIWARTYGDRDKNRGYSVKQTTDGGYIVAGLSDAHGVSEEDFYLVKTDSIGDTLWTKAYGGDSPDICYSVTESTYGGYVLAGSSESFGTGTSDMWFVRTDANGDSLWTKPLVGTFWDEARCIEQTSDGGCIITGGFNDWLLVLIKISSSPISPFDLLSPVDSIVLPTSRPTFIWEECSAPNELSYYEVYIDDIARCQTTDTFWLADYDLTEGFHQWYASAVDTFGNRIQSNQTWTVFIDTSGPSIDSTTVWPDTSYTGPFPVYTNVIDNSEVDTVILYYQRTEDPTWFFAGMTEGMDNWYNGLLPEVFMQDDTVKYYIYAEDIGQQSSTDPTGAPTNYYSFIANFTGIMEHQDMPRVFSFGLMGNPSRNKALFSLALPSNAFITLSIYDVLGRLVDTPIAGKKSAGYYNISWSPDAAGVFFYKLDSPWEHKVGKLVLLK